MDKGVHETAAATQSEKDVDIFLSKLSLPPFPSTQLSLYFSHVCRHIVISIREKKLYKFNHHHHCHHHYLYTLGQINAYYLWKGNIPSWEFYFMSILLIIVLCTNTLSWRNVSTNFFFIHLLYLFLAVNKKHFAIFQQTIVMLCQTLFE